MALDYAVALAEGHSPFILDYGVHGSGVFVPNRSRTDATPYSPTQDEKLAVALYERNGIALVTSASRPAEARWCAVMDSHLPLPPSNLSRVLCHGPDQITAFCRVLVQAKVGQVVDLPGILVSPEMLA
ncbi:hypothetical protein HNP46_000322 [Pseudomonas nitritireducens]|uniref:Uncharacterized protein n=1 Tax=Pseudomonas nitroreducens TaxID=46680 RepID=A0A7W7KFI7_PSENT|nr:hypothetical protein [Pseudomonas nitritireducens]MBB4861511.1 hypothetical protein [Pseudomonas nitritireducens]